MIRIVNVDPNPRESGEHLYEVGVNNEPAVATFTHHREMDLSHLLHRAYLAVSEVEKQQRLEKISRELGVKVGSIVVDPKGKNHRVVHIDAPAWRQRKPWLVGNPIRKDGTYGTARRNLYNDWELVES